MNKIALVILASVALMSVGACAGVGKGKGKAPPPYASPVITKGWTGLERLWFNLGERPRRRRGGDGVGTAAIARNRARGRSANEGLVNAFSWKGARTFVHDSWEKTRLQHRKALRGGPDRCHQDATSGQGFSRSGARPRTGRCRHAKHVPARQVA